MTIFLASSSPRRRQLLANVGFKFKVIKPDSDELMRKGESPRAMVKRLAIEKAEAAFEKLPRNSVGVIISADTTVVSPDRKHVLNKPRSVGEAKKMLRSIAGKNHTVLTGYAIFAIGGGRIQRRHSAVVKTLVKMRKLTNPEISRYVASGEPMDKAGAYAAQGIGMCLIESTRGSYSNVVGLPMAELVADLAQKFDLRPKWSVKR